MAQPLEGIRVVELATGVAGPFVGKLLADFGADVIKIEPPDGDESRRAGPFPAEAPDDPEQSALFLHLNTNKRSAVADLTTAAGRDLVLGLAGDADVLVESEPPGRLAALGIGVDALHAVQPALVVTSITPFGQDGPYADYRGADIVTYAMGGPMSGTGVAEREPVKLAGEQITFQVGQVAALATFAAMLRARDSGRGDHVDVAAFEAQAGSIDRRVTYLLFHQWSGDRIPRPPTRTQAAAPAGMYPVLDGHVQILTIAPWIPRMLDVLDDDDLRERFADPAWATDDTLPDAVDAVLYPWLLSRTRSEAAHDGQAGRWPITPLNTPVDVIDDPHFAERGFFVETTHPVAGTLRQPGAPFRLGDAWQLRRPAPTLGQHQAEVDALAGCEARREVVTATPRLPLDGIRVVDMTVVWAGPACTLHLSDLGAEVVKVDNPFVFPTATRGNSPRPPAEQLRESGPLVGAYPGLEPGERPWNRHGMFAAQARNKLSCTLDVRTDLGRSTFLRLVAAADVLVENNSRGVLDRLELGWDVLSAANPRLVVLRMPPMGLTGPYSDWIGFGAHFEALCGMTGIRGYADGDPAALKPVFHMDPASGAGGAFAVLCALERRRHSGRGELVDFAQSENMLQHIGDHLIDAERTGRPQHALGNRHPTRAPQGCYPCAGDDEWVVISVGPDDEWTALRKAMDDPAWAADPALATIEGRRAHHDEIDEHLAAWTAPLDAYEVFHRCQRAGVAAGPVLDEAALLADPHMAARRFFRDQGSPDLGTWRFPRHQWRWTGPEMPYGPIAQLGRDNDYVYRDVLGLTDAEYDALAAAGHITDTYLDADGFPV